MSEYFPEPNYLGRRVKDELDLAKYTKNSYLKNATGVDASKPDKKTDLSSLKSSVDKLDIDKLKNIPTTLRNLESKVDKLDADKLVPTPVDLSKLNVVKKDVKI